MSALGLMLHKYHPLWKDATAEKEGSESRK